ncbi:hypothetical protein GUJ93_ZPchr0006g46351 [Zizania palustris]|uniref:Uncharacterized protein n=1 Tax=Zizania palustris TaxID=103762 RepID=A0A8J5SEG3_ZIZPA|nr:hypothetical protein GUJ93_ZPchr0006g46351 [Zizania palustris]
MFPDGVGGDSQVERKPIFRRSCEWLVCPETNRGALEPSRHSWDGSMVSKAFACSFACLEEPPDGVRRVQRGNCRGSGWGGSHASVA